MHAPSVLTILRGCLLGRKRSKHKKLKSRIVDIDLLVSVLCSSSRTESEDESSTAYHFHRPILWSHIQEGELTE